MYVRGHMPWHGLAGRTDNIGILTTCRTHEARANRTVVTWVLWVYRTVQTRATCVVRSSKWDVPSTQGVSAALVQCLCKANPIAVRLFTLWCFDPS